MRLFFYFVPVLLAIVESGSVFKSIPVTVKAYENDTVLLPCYVDESVGSQIRVRWYKNEDIIGDSKDAHRLLPPRLRMLANFSLEVERVAAVDTAEYTCEVIRSEPWAPMRQTHYIEVQYSPTIRTVPEDGYLEVRKGEYVDIGCEASGSPEPIVNWKKNGEQMALLEHRSRIRFRAEHRLLAGDYQCEVNNGVGDPVTANIRVVIQDAPVVSAARSTVHTAPGLRAALAATLEFAHPAPLTRWFMGHHPVHTDDRVVVMVQGDTHQLIFRSVRESDLGNYTFRAENKFGMADIMFKLTGVPNAASFKVDQALNKATPVSFTLIWEVDSYSTILEYNLWIRPYVRKEDDEEGKNMWRKIMVPGDSSDGPIHSASYTVRGLTPSTVFEAIVTSRNKFGWSKQSAILHFATEPGVGNSVPSTSDYSEITPLLEDPQDAMNITQARVFHSQSSFGTKPRAAIFVMIVNLLICLMSSLKLGINCKINK